MKLKTLSGDYHQLFRLEVFYCKPEIDLFASCINYQIGQYTSWYSDRNAIAVDAFSISWSELNFYAFPPFSLIGAAMAKVRQEKCSGIMIIPWWKTQFWFPMMASLLKNFPIFLSPSIPTLTSKRSAKLSLYPKKKLLAIHLSGKDSETQTFQEKSIWLTQKSSLLNMVIHINLHHLVRYQDGSRTSWVWQV